MEAVGDKLLPEQYRKWASGTASLPAPLFLVLRAINLVPPGPCPSLPAQAWLSLFQSPRLRNSVKNQYHLGGGPRSGDFLPTQEGVFY